MDPRQAPSAVPPELRAAIAEMDSAQLRALTDELLDLSAARALRLARSTRPSRRRSRADTPFSLVVRVDLVGAKPPVWRRVELPSTLLLSELHDLAQLLFDWDDAHLHRFALGSSVWDRDAELFLCPYDVQEGEDEGLPADQVRLDEVLAEPGDKLRYVYDYGDEWTLLFKVERVLPDADRPRCTGGRGAPPPEDSGGVWDWDGSAGPRLDVGQLDRELADWDADRD